MRNRFSVVLGGIVLLAGSGTSTYGSEKIKAFVASDGRVVYSNTVSNKPAPIPAPAPPPVAAIPVQGGSAPIHALIDSIAATHGVDPALVKAVVKTESNFDRWAVSNKGARGLMQLIPETGRRFGVKDFFDPRQNIEGGVRYMKFLLEKFDGNLYLSLAAYNAGENLVERLGRIPSIPETRNYVRKVRSHYGKSQAMAQQAQQAQITPVVAPVAPTVAPTGVKEQRIFRTVDERGVVHFSNVAPPK